MAEPGGGADLDPATPSLARIHDYVLGGYHNFASDRAVADALLRQDATFRQVVYANRAFLGRCVRFLCAQGIDQFLDLGSGLPTMGHVHAVAQEINPAVHVVYVEIDPIAVQHSRDILRDQPTVTAIQADVFQPETVLAHAEARRLLDWSRPLAILLLSVLHFLPDDAQARQVVRTLRAALPSGGYLALSHGTVWIPHPTRAGTGRSQAEVAPFFEGLELVEPGIVYTPQWRPQDGDLFLDQPERGMTVAGVGRKP